MASTYSEIHGNTLHENTSRSTNRYGNRPTTGDVKSNQSINIMESNQPPESKSHGALSVYHLSSTKSKSRKKSLLNSSNWPKTDSDMKSPSFKTEEYTQDCNQDTHYNMKCKKGDIATNYFGSCKRFHDNKCEIRPSPYQTDTIEDKKQNFQTKSKNRDQNYLNSRSGWVSKPSALNGNIMDMYDSAISFSDYLGNRSTLSSSPFPEGNQRMKSQKSVVSDDSLNSEIGFSTLAVTNLDSDNTNYASMEKDEDIITVKIGNRKGIKSKFRIYTII